MSVHLLCAFLFQIYFIPAVIKILPFVTWLETCGIYLGHLFPHLAETIVSI